ncbi:MAG: hypothetical protein ACRCWY_07280 [Cellulosilyticaceae bacterium]
MAKSKFDEFMNLYDRETGGKYSYYYRQIWDACKHANDCYEAKYKKSIWEQKKYKEEWLGFFMKGMKKDEQLVEIQKNVESHLQSWVVGL